MSAHSKITLVGGFSWDKYDRTDFAHTHNGADVIDGQENVYQLPATFTTTCWYTVDDISMLTGRLLRQVRLPYTFSFTINEDMTVTYYNLKGDETSKERVLCEYHSQGQSTIDPDFSFPACVEAHVDVYQKQCDDVECTNETCNPECKCGCMCNAGTECSCLCSDDMDGLDGLDGPCDCTIECGGDHDCRCHINCLTSYCTTDGFTFLYVQVNYDGYGM